MTPFATTSWTVIARTRQPGEESRRAIAALCRQYWHALYVYARRAGHSADLAEDTVQGFLAHVVEHDVFAQAQSERGRFRTFLLAALRQFMAHQHRDQTRQKRAPSAGLISLNIEQAESLHAASAGAPPDAAFDRAWAMTQLDLAWQRLESEYCEAGKTGVIAALRPVVSGQAARPIKDLAAELSMTEGALNVAAHRLRRRFGEVLRELIAQTTDSPVDVDDEIARLRNALARRPEDSR